ncbi:hypothetical protein [Salipiger sp. PrR003]|uniref:hypothetical protein n=1 Tax=Salipiger sp. PrR003 TaxID=2706776 RepID=UPI0013DD4459|nr:hypothetical protein [Salipiger sp. PrR003]NDV52952.1 hypothetical protein [Salipiger sp. PrR003]
MTENSEKAKALVLVHPGSMCGSAAMQIGRGRANELRKAVLKEVSEHSGPLVVIDGFLSGELSPQENDLIMEALQRNAEQGHFARRFWGCDGGEEPFAAWESFGALEGEQVEFEEQQAAAEAFASHLAHTEIRVSGAWATDDLSSGCATSVLIVLREQLGENVLVRHSLYAFYEPVDTFEDDPEPDFSQVFRM